MASAPLASESRRLLQLARRDREAASSSLKALSTEQQVDLLRDAPLADRAKLLALMPEPEAVIPRIPDAELTFLVKSVGLRDASWILAHATPEQIVAGVDLDAWQGYEVDVRSLSEWIAALADTDTPALLRAARALDAELLALLLQARLEVVLKPNDDEGWQPPEKAQTLEGQFYFVAREDGDDVEEIVAMLRTLFEEDYWTYFRLMQSAIWELQSDAEEWALRWRAGRLQDLGFPPWEEAMRLYRFVRPEERARASDAERPLDVEPWSLPVWVPTLPDTGAPEHRVFRAIAALGEAERAAAFYAFVAVANQIAVADRMPLSDAESTPRAIEKAARLISEGLAFVAAERELHDAEVLRRVSLERLFTVGANLDPSGALP